MNPGRTFTLEMGSDGATSLQKVILKKLTEFMGDYTDDVLAQYVLVLVAHGKQQAQTAKDLEAFLGDQSETFVAWLWNYLCSNLHLHASVSKASVMGGERLEQRVEQTDNGIAKGAQADAQVSASKHKHEEKLRNDSSSATVLPDLNGPPPKLENSDYRMENEISQVHERNAGRHSRHTAKRQRSPWDTETKRERKKETDAKHHRKRHRTPLKVNATRRLLQSAVREAVAPVANLAKSGSKRLRSVVSTEVGNTMTLEDANNPRADKEVDDVRQGKAGATAALADTKALATAAENAMIAPESVVGSVWDRLGRTARDLKEIRLKGEPGYSSQFEDRRFFSTNSRLDHEGGNNTILLEHPLRLTAPSLTRANGYATVETSSEGQVNPHRNSHHQENTRKEARFLDPMHSQHVRVDDAREVSVATQSRQARTADTGIKEAQKAPSTSALSRQCEVSQKHVVCSQGQEPVASQTALPQMQTASVEGDSHQNVLELKKRLDYVQAEMTKLRARQSEANKEPQVVPSSTLPEQVQRTQDSLHRRIIFATNIHFAATKESITAHFAQCGKVEQVVMLMDGATGKPKGSAYVEFSMPTEADKALALNDTSFYSRIMKVMPTDASMIQEMHSNQSTSIRHPNHLLSIPSARTRVFRGPFNPVSGFSSMRGAYASPTKMQWKRDSAAIGRSTSAANGNKPGIVAPVRMAVKSFTYVRDPAVKEGGVEAQKGAT